MPRKKKCVIPKEYKNLWNEDHDELTEAQRVEMVETYMNILEDYELGVYSNKLDPPLFMTQRDKIKKHEIKKRKDGIADRIKREQERIAAEEKKKAREEEEQQQKVAATQEKIQRYQQLVDKWGRDSVFALNIEERLRFENVQLRMDLLQTNIAIMQEKLQVLDANLDELAERCASKYEFNLEEYDLDLVGGKFTRKPTVQFPYSPKDFPKN